MKLSLKHIVAMLQPKQLKLKKSNIMCSNCSSKLPVLIACNRLSMKAVVRCENTSEDLNMFGYYPSNKLLQKYRQTGMHSVINNQQQIFFHKENMAGGKQNVTKSIFMSPKSILEASPKKYQPYLKLMRFDRPIGTWLLFIPCTWSISLAAAPGALPDFGILSLFGLGAFLMRGAGCTINDLWDKDFDAKVERTKDRPLASGELTNFKAVTFLGLQLSAALAILLTFNWYTIFLGASSLSLVVLYPLMKRFTYWPQAFLGLTFNWGALLGWSATVGHVEWAAALSLYAACMSWTMVYDTIYAHQDKQDDVLIGVKSTALKFGEQSKPVLAGFTAAMIACLTGTGILCDQTLPYYAGVAFVAAHLSHQIYTVDLNNPENCGNKFRSNKNLGLMFWAAIIAGNLLKDKKKAESEQSNDATS